MKNKKTKLFLVMLGLGVLSLASCNPTPPNTPDTPITEHTHVYGELHEEVAPTCETAGKKAYYECECGQLFDSDKHEVTEASLAIPALGHHIEHKEGTAPDCVNPGTGEYYECSVCHKKFSDEDGNTEISAIPTIPATGHVYKKVNSVPATCTSFGVKEYYACDCGHSFAEDEHGEHLINDLAAWKEGAGRINKLAHEYGTPTVTWEGKSATASAKCSHCDDVISETKEGTFVEDSVATCCAAQKGHYAVTFENELFGSAQTEASSVTGTAATGEHNYGDVEVTWNGKSATAKMVCKTDGCGDVVSETKDGEFVEDTPASCTTDQKGHYEVTFNDTRLGSAQTEANGIIGEPPGEHSYSVYSVQWNGASATAKAKCIGCTKEIEETKVGSFVEDTAATCHSAQTGHYEVTFNDTRLGSARTEANTATGAAATGEHTYGDVTVTWNGKSATAKASCTNEGCTDEISETKDGDFVEDTAATCHSAQTGHYEVTFNDTRLGTASSDANSATGAAATGEHTYGTAEVSWNGSSATATATCTAEGCDAYITETKEGTFVEDTAVTCTAPQKGHYEVTFNDSRLGSASTTVNSVENGDPHAHTYGDLVPQVDPLRETAGKKAYYKCSECNGYFDSDKNPVNESSLVIPAPAQHFDAAANLTISLEPIATTETIYVDIKFVGAQADSKINISLLGTKDDGGNDWDNYLGYFELYEKSVATNAGISAATITDDGWFRIKIDMNAITKVSGVKPASVNALYVRGGWSNVEGYIEVNSAVSAHTKASELIPAKAAGPHGDDGYQAHYECTGCNDYWFNESGALCKKEDLIIKSNVVKYAPPASGNTFAEFKNLGNITDKVSVDIHFDNPTVHQEVGFNFYESAWDNYYGTFWVDCDNKGVYFEGDYAGITLDELTDGWWRVTAYPSALNQFKNDKTEIEQKHSIDMIYIKAPNTIENRGSGTFELNSAYEGIVPSTKVYSLSGKNSLTTDRVFFPGETINLDINFKNNTQAQIDLMTGWDAVCRFKVNPNGTIVDQKEGIQVFKLNNELVGYPTLEGTWYRIVINTNNITPMTVGYPSIMRIGGNNWNEAEFDMMINSPYTTDGWYTFAGGSSNTQINVKSPNIGVIRDSNGDLVNGKAFQFKVKGEGTGNVKFSLMEHNSWKNCNNMNLIFENSVLTEAVCSGSPNKWAKVDDLGNGVYSVTVPFEKMLADGFGEAKTIGFFYGDGVIANGLTSFSINLLDIGLVDYVA